MKSAPIAVEEWPSGYIYIYALARPSTSHHSHWWVSHQAAAGDSGRLYPSKFGHHAPKSMIPPLLPCTKCTHKQSGIKSGAPTTACARHQIYDCHCSAHHTTTHTTLWEGREFLSHKPPRLFSPPCLSLFPYPPSSTRKRSPRLTTTGRRPNTLSLERILSAIPFIIFLLYSVAID